jgi:uncharacterized protein (TIGR02270 family)
LTTPVLTFLPDLVEEHLEEIQFLWPIRERGLRSPRMTMRDMRSFDDRIDAHADGALVPGDGALSFIEPLLDADDEFAAFAATFVLLRRGTAEACDRVRAAFAEATGTRLRGISRALQMGAGDALIADIAAAFKSDDPVRCAFAAEALCYRTRWRRSHERLLALLSNEDPLVKVSAWRSIANLGLTVEPPTLAAAVDDDDASVRAAALYSAAWTGTTSVLPIARAAAASPKKEDMAAYGLLAALGETADAILIARLIDTPALGPERFALAAALGAPKLAPLLLEALGSSNPREAIAAGAAFTRLTGADLGPGPVVTLPPEDGHEPDAFEQEFLEEDTLPDAAKGRAHWNRIAPAVGTAARIAHGHDVSTSIPPDAVTWLDMQARHEWWMRARFRGQWAGSPMHLDVFPQRV